MPKKQLTAEAIAKIIEANKKNFKYSPYDFGEVSERLQNAAKKYNRLKEFENATLSPQGKLVISNKKEVQTELNVSGKREYYSRASFQNTFDTEIVQLLTAKPEEPNTPPPPLPIFQPPPAPTDVRLTATNHHWSMDGKRGRTEKDSPEWKNNTHPLGNNPKGGYLIIPDDHPLFYLSHCEPKEARSSFNYEWKVDGEIVSTSPSFHMYNCSDQGQGVDDWHKQNKPWHTHWQDQPDVMVEVRVWNESGEMKAKAPYRCAYNVGDEDQIDNDGKPLPRWKWKGTKYFDEKTWLKGKWPLTDYKFDQKYKPRKVVLRQINILDFEETVYKRASRFAPKPWSPKQKLDVSLDRFRKFVTRGWFGAITHNWSKESEKAHKENVKAYNNKKDDAKLPNPYNLNDEWAMIGVVYLDDTEVTLNDLWSGYDAKGFDKYNFTNFMRLDKNGNTAKTSKGNNSTKTEDGTTAMERMENELSITVPHSTSAKVGFKFGYKKSGDGSTKDLKYLYWDAMKTINVHSNSPEVIYVDLDAKAEEITFDSTLYNWKGEAKDKGKFIKSQAKKNLGKMKSTYNRTFGRWL
jgi:hypothetical protein